MDSQTKSARKLSEISLNAQCAIQSLLASPETCQRLREIGLYERTLVRLVARTSSQIICELHNTRIGLHNRVADAILVVGTDTLQN